MAVRGRRPAAAGRGPHRAGRAAGRPAGQRPLPGAGHPAGGPVPADLVPGPARPDAVARGRGHPPGVRPRRGRAGHLRAPDPRHPAPGLAGRPAPGGDDLQPRQGRPQRRAAAALPGPAAPLQRRGGLVAGRPPAPGGRPRPGLRLAGADGHGGGGRGLLLLRPGQAAPRRPGLGGQRQPPLGAVRLQRRPARAQPVRPVRRRPAAARPAGRGGHPGRRARLPAGAVAAPAGLAVRPGGGGHARRHRPGHAPGLLGQGRHRAGRDGRLAGPGRPPPRPRPRRRPGRPARPRLRGGATMSPEADLIIVGAPVWTGDPARPWAEAVAVRGGRVAAAGPERELAGLRGPATRVLALDGGLVLPGFADAHVHTAAGGLELTQCDLRGGEREEYPAPVARYAAEHPDLGWVLGGGWVMDAFGTAGPHLAALDAVVADRPVMLESTDGHSAWVNSRALELAGITRATPDPPRGRIERDAAGEPTGALHEAARALVADLAPEPTQAEWEVAIERGQAHLHRLGITAWQDAAVEPEMLAAYRAVAERGRLTGRAVAALRWEVEAGQAQLPGLVERRRAGTVGRLRAGAVKIFADGVFENRTAAMLEPYLDGDGHPTGNLGIGMLGPEELAKVVTALDSEGFDVHVHAIGDRAVRDTLDAFEAAAAANGRRDARHQIAHLQFVHPDDRPRFRRLGVVANAQPYWSCVDGYMRDLTLPFLEPERAGWQYPWASLRQA